MQGDDRLYFVLFAAGDHVPVVLHFGLNELLFLRFDPGPFNAEAIGAQIGSCHQTDVLFVAVVVVYGIQAGLYIAGMLHLLLGPAIAVDIVSLYLVGGCSGAQQKLL